MESLVQKRDQLFRILVSLSRQEQYNKSDIEGMKVFMDQLKTIEKQLKSQGYKGPYLTDNKSRRQPRRKSTKKRRSRSKSPKRRKSKRKSPKKRQRGGAAKGSDVQSIMFKKHLWTVPKAVEWLDKHNYAYDKVDITDQYLRFRQFPPRGEMRTITFSEDDGIKAVLSYGKRKRSSKKRKRSKSKGKKK